MLCLGNLMIVLDTTIVNVALPSIRDGPRLLRVVAGLGRQRLPADLRRLPAARADGSATCSATAGCSSSASPPSPPPRSPAAWPGSPAVLVAARAVQGLGGAVVSAVALSLVMNLFTEPAERAKAMGFIGFVAAGGGSIGVLLGGVLTDSLDWHWIFLVNAPIGVAVSCCRCGSCRPRTRAGRRHAARRRRRGHRDRRADARGLRDRQRQRGRLDVGPDRRPARRGRRRCSPCSSGSSRAVARRSCRWACSGCATSRSPTSSASSGPPRCSPGSSSRRCTCSWCSATARCRSAWPSCRRTW